MGWKAWHNACDWDNCETCPHEDCISNEELAEKRLKQIKKTQHNSAKRRYDLRKSLNICVRCGKKNSENGSIYCFKCRNDHRKALSKHQKKYYVIKVRNNDLCYRCRQRPKIVNHELCEKCFEDSKISCMKARVKRNKNKIIKFFSIIITIIKANQKEINK